MRTKKTEERYRRYQKTHFKLGQCTLCDRKKVKPRKVFHYWKIINNWFPWDLIAKTHHLIIPKRHVAYDKLNRKEKSELEKLKLGYINNHYGIIAEATHRKKSIPDHFHLHLITPK